MSDPLLTTPQRRIYLRVQLAAAETFGLAPNTPLIVCFREPSPALLELFPAAVGTYPRSRLLALADACYALDTALYERRRAFWHGLWAGWKRARDWPQSACDWAGSRIYLCGIPRFLVQFRNQLLLLGIGARQIMRRF